LFLCAKGTSDQGHVQSVYSDLGHVQSVCCGQGHVQSIYCDLDEHLLQDIMAQQSHNDKVRIICLDFNVS